MCQFDHEYESLYDFSELTTVTELSEQTFVPRGWTALYDAIGKQIIETGKKLKDMEEEDRPEKVIFVILTDGEENQSKEFRGEQGRQAIQQMITHQTEKYSWAFMFLGANIDAEKVGATLGIDRDFSATFGATAKGVETTFDIMSAKLGGMRREAGPLYCMGKKTPVAMAASYSAEDKAAMNQ